MSYTTIRLILDIIGACILILGEMRTTGTHIKRHRGPIKTLFHQKIPVHLAKMFGSDKAEDTQDYTVGAFSNRFWGLTFLVVGFIFEIADNVCSNQQA